jgi:hypothetical protein
MDILDSAVRVVLDADSGQYTHEMVDKYYSLSVLKRAGSYDLRDQSVEVVVEHYTERANEEPVGLELAETWTYRIVGGSTYVSSADWPDGASRCWLVADEEVVGEFVGEHVDPAGAPLAVSALEDVAGESFDPQDKIAILGTVDLDTALHLMLAAEPAAELADQFDGRVRARFELSDGAVSAWQVTGTEVLDALLETADPLDVRDAATALKVFNLRVSYSQLNSNIDIEEPAPDSHMTLSQMDTGEGCQLME